MKDWAGKTGIDWKSARNYDQSLWSLEGLTWNVQLGWRVETGGLLSQFLKIGQHKFQGRVGCSGVHGKVEEVTGSHDLTKRGRDAASAKLKSQHFLKSGHTYSRTLVHMPVRLVTTGCSRWIISPFKAKNHHFFLKHCLLPDWNNHPSTSQLCTRIQ